MNDTKEKLLNEWSDICDAAETSLNEWSGDGNLQFPVLLGMIALRLNLDEKQVRRADPIVREYVRNHTGWYVTRGAKGGIMRAADKQKKEDEKIARELQKKQMKAEIEAKAAAKAAEATDPVDAADTSDQEDSE